MKTKYIVLIGLFAATFAACSRDEENLFDKSAAQRTQEALDNANAVLTGAEYGWEMAYFPNIEDTENTRGFGLVIKFNENTNVSISAKNDLITGGTLQTDSSSTWVVKSDYGPLLSFDTYNSIFHKWSDPQSNPQSIGMGYMGDYEFLILNATPELVLLKGKKYGAYTIMRPMQTNDIAAYFKTCEQMEDSLFGNNNAVVLEMDGKKYHLYNGSAGMFYDAPYLEPLAMEATTNHPFYTTTDGIIMSKGFGDNKDERFFKWENNQLVGEKGSVLTNIGVVSYLDFFLKTLAGTWAIDLENLCETIKTNIAQVDEQLKSTSKKAKKNAGTKGIELAYDAKTQKYTLKYRYTLETRNEELPLQFFYDVTFGENTFELSYVEPADEGAATLISVITSINDLLKSLNGVYSVSSSNIFNPTKGIKFINESNADIWYYLSGKVE